MNVAATDASFKDAIIKVLNTTLVYTHVAVRTRVLLLQTIAA